MDLEVNGYSIYIEIEEITPPIGNVYTHEAKVTRVIDRRKGRMCEAASGTSSTVRAAMTPGPRLQRLRERGLRRNEANASSHFCRG